MPCFYCQNIEILLHQSQKNIDIRQDLKMYEIIKNNWKTKRSKRPAIKMRHGEVEIAKTTRWWSGNDESGFDGKSLETNLIVKMADLYRFVAE